MEGSFWSENEQIWLNLQDPNSQLAQNLIHINGNEKSEPGIRHDNRFDGGSNCKKERGSLRINPLTGRLSTSERKRLIKLVFGCENYLGQVDSLSGLVY